MRKKRKPSIKISVPRLIISLSFISFVIYGIVTLITQQLTIVKYNEKNIQLHNEILTQQQLQADLDRQNQEVGTPEYNERLAREKLGLVKDNEKVFIDENNQ